MSYKAAMIGLVSKIAGYHLRVITYTMYVSSLEVDSVIIR